jgi:hypothetical protein
MNHDRPTDSELAAMVGGNPMMDFMQNVTEQQFAQAYTCAVLQCMEEECITLEAAMGLVRREALSREDEPRKRGLLLECESEMRHYMTHLYRLVDLDRSGNTTPRYNLHQMSEEELRAHIEAHRDDSC